MNAISAIRQFIIPLRDFIYPPVCFVCSQRLRNDEDRICSTCWNSFTDVYPSNPTWIELKTKLDSQGSVDDLVSRYLFEKEGRLQEVIHLLKYQGMKSLGVKLGHELGHRILEVPNFARADCLVPIPLHKLKQRERGYNQSELVCRGISEVTGIRFDRSLVLRTKYTESQTTLSLEERQANVDGAFAIDPEEIGRIEGKTFILVDDVITTGSTINACARRLRRAGASCLLAASVALAQ